MKVSEGLLEYQNQMSAGTNFFDDPLRKLAVMILAVFLETPAHSANFHNKLGETI